MAPRCPMNCRLVLDMARNCQVPHVSIALALQPQSGVTHLRSRIGLASDCRYRVAYVHGDRVRAVRSPARPGRFQPVPGSSACRRCGVRGHGRARVVPRASDPVGQRPDFLASPRGGLKPVSTRPRSTCLRVAAALWPRQCGAESHRR